MNVVDDQVDSDFARLRDRTKASRNLGPIVAGQAISLFGDYIAYFTLPLFIVSLTGSAADLGLTVVAETIPMLLFGFAAGVFLDRRPSLTRTLILADWIRALTFLSLAAAAIAGVAETWMVFGAAFLIGTMGVFFDSGLQALLPGVLEEDMLVTANSRLALARTLAMTVGPAAGGILVAAGGGFGTAFTVNAITFVASASFLVFVRRTRPRTPIAGEAFGSSLRHGLGFLMREPFLRWGTIGGAVTNLVFAPLEALLVLFVVERIPPIRLSGALSWMFAGEASVGLFFGAQALIGSIGVALAPAVAKRIRLGRMYVTGLVMLGGGFAVVSFLQSFWAVIPTGIALTGVAWVNVALSTLRQRLTPEPLLGRVIAASRTVVWIGLPLGAGLGGVLGGVYGLVPVYVTGAAAVLVVAVLLRFTPLWHSPMTAAGPMSPPVPGAAAPSVPLAERIVREARGERSGPIGIRDGSLLAIAAVLWGSSFLFVAKGLESVHPAVITSSRLLLAALVLGAFPAARQRIDRHDWPTLITMSLLWMAVPLMLIAVAQQWIDSSVAGMVSGGVPLFSVLIAAALLGRLPGTRRMLGLAIGFLGLALIVAQSVEASSDAASGAGLVITAALCLGFAMHLMVPLQQKYGSLPVLLRAFLVAAAATLPFGLAGLADSTYSASSATAILVLGVFGTAAAYVAMAVLVGHRGMTGAAVAAYFVPHIAVVLGVVAGNESVSGIVLSGIAVMLLGIFLTQELPAGPPPQTRLPTVVPASVDGEA